ncbi:MAG: secretion protein HylD, partial [Magnetococcales bacterium]|nr:secretion protein HylD [Magnetococcales bacterium]
MTAPLSPLVLLLQRLQRARETRSLEELHFAMVNETLSLISYRQAILWNGSGKVEALSGIPVLDHQVPFVLWLN